MQQRHTEDSGSRLRVTGRHTPAAAPDITVNSVTPTRIPSMLFQCKIFGELEHGTPGPGTMYGNRPRSRGDSEWARGNLWRSSLRRCELESQPGARQGAGGHGRPPACHRRGAALPGSKLRRQAEPPSCQIMARGADIRPGVKRCRECRREARRPAAWPPGRV